MHGCKQKVAFGRNVGVKLGKRKSKWLIGFIIEIEENIS